MYRVILPNFEITLGRYRRINQSLIELKFPRFSEYENTFQNLCSILSNYAFIYIIRKINLINRQRNDKITINFYCRINKGRPMGEKIHIISRLHFYLRVGKFVLTLTRLSLSCIGFYNFPTIASSLVSNFHWHQNQSKCSKFPRDNRISVLWEISGPYLRNRNYFENAILLSIAPGISRPVFPTYYIK